MSELVKTVKTLEWLKAILWREIGRLKLEDPREIEEATTRIDQLKRDVEKQFERVRKSLSFRKGRTSVG